MNVLIVHYSLFGHTHFLAEAIEKGASEVEGAVVEMRRVPEIMSWDEIERRGAERFQKSFVTIPSCSMEDIKSADAIFFGAPTYFGNMCGQLQQFLYDLRQLWSEGALVGKVGSAFASSVSQHGGQDVALLSICTAMLHLGMVVAGLPCTFKEQMHIDQILAGVPYGATTITGQMGELKPTENDLKAAYFQGKHVAAIASKLIRR